MKMTSLLREVCHAVTLRTSSLLCQSAGCQLVRLCVSSELHSCQAEDDDEAVQDECFYVAEFQFWSLFFGVFCFLASSILSSLTFNFAGDPPTVIFEGHLTNGHKNGKVPKTDLLVVSKDLCFGAPRLVQIDEPHNLEVQSWDPWRPLSLDSPSEPSQSARLQYLWVSSCPHLVFSRYPVFAHASCSRIFS